MGLDPIFWKSWGISDNAQWGVLISYGQGRSKHKASFCLWGKNSMKMVCKSVFTDSQAPLAFFFVCSGEW